MKNFPRNFDLPFNSIRKGGKEGSIFSAYWFIDDLIKNEVNLKRASQDISYLQKNVAHVEPVCAPPLVTASVSMAPCEISNDIV